MNILIINDCVYTDVSPLVSARSNGDKLSEPMSRCFRDMDHIRGVIQDMVLKDRKPALSTGLDLKQPEPESEPELVQVKVTV